MCGVKKFECGTQINNNVTDLLSNNYIVSSRADIAKSRGSANFAR